MADTRPLLTEAQSQLRDGDGTDGKSPERPGRALLSAAATLTLSILGSSVLPLPFAFSRMGILLGMATMLVVGFCNAHTCSLLLRAAGSTGHDSYEGVAEAIGGRTWKVITQVSLFLLLFGTLCGDFALLHDAGLRAVHALWLGPPPGWLVVSDGRVVVVLLALLVVFPLCCLRRMRSLEIASYGGFGVVLAVIAIVAWNAVSTGFPAIHSGELKVWSLNWTPDLPEAFAVLGFAFYIQPMLMPLVHEMPRGDLGIQLTKQAVNIVVFGVAVVVYGLVGIFGAARFGLAIQGDLLVNTWLGGRAEGVLDAVLVAYLAISIPPVQLSLRYTLDCLVAGEDAPYSQQRHTVLTVLVVFSSLGVALIFPTYAEKIFAVTGATAVAVVCYFIPVVLHLMMRRQRRLQVLPAGEDGGSRLSQKDSWTGLLHEVALPLVVLGIGMGVSALALKPLLFSKPSGGRSAS